MKTLKLLPLFLLSFLLPSCEKDTKTNDIDISLLEKKWIQSYEESYNTYRPSDYKDFPPSRYRQVFIFKENNICSYRVLAPNDAHYYAEGQWRFNKRDNILQIISSESKVLYRYKIIELSEDILRVERE